MNRSGMHACIHNHSLASCMCLFLFCLFFSGHAVEAQKSFSAPNAPAVTAHGWISQVLAVGFNSRPWVYMLIDVRVLVNNHADSADQRGINLPEAIVITKSQYM